MFGTNGTRPWDKLGPVPGTSRLFSVEFHSKIATLSRFSPGWGFEDFLVNEKDPEVEGSRSYQSSGSLVVF